MHALHLQQLAPAPEVDVDVAVCRYVSTGGEHQCLISDAAGQGAAGPPGFELLCHRVPPHGKLRVASVSSRQRVLVVSRGQLQRLGGARLGPRSLTLIERGRSAELRNDGGQEAYVLEITWVPRTGRPLPPGRRVARVEDMTPLRKRLPFRLVPPGVQEFLSPRDLYPALGPPNHGPVRFRVAGPDELVVVFAHTPPGTGPALHVHKLTTEMFCVLEGTFEVRWGDHGEHHLLLEPHDAIVLPRHVNRAFTARSEDAWLLPIVTGTNDETEDIAWLEHVFDAARVQAPRMAALLSRRVVQVGRRSLS